MLTGRGKSTGCARYRRLSAEHEQKKREIITVTLFITCFFKVVHFDDLLASVSCSQSHDVEIWVDFHHAVSFHAVHKSFVAMVVHLQRQGEGSKLMQKIRITLSFAQVYHLMVLNKHPV